MAADNEEPLLGKTILVTRAQEQAKEFVAKLEGLGAKVIVHSMIRHEDPEDFTALDRAIQTLETFDWLLFTSQNAVSFFLKRCHALGVKLPATLQIAAIGPKTADAARREGCDVQYTPEEYVGPALVEGLRERLRMKRVLYPMSDLAGRGPWVTLLRGEGANVTEVVAYRTVGPRPEKFSSGPLVRMSITKGKLDVITFFSPSAFRHMAEGDGLNSLREAARFGALAAIGPTTAAAIREAGLTVAIVAKEQTAAGLAAAICDYFAQRTEPERERR